MIGNLMIQGTMSGVGKSVLTAGILRVLSRKGFRTAPFKSQNMALNSFVTPDGLEIGRAQALQAAAAFRLPESDMNPILLKPMGDTVSQVILNGIPYRNMRAKEYFSEKKRFLPEVLSAYNRLAQTTDIIVIEGAGSPAEINLRENDIVNMGLAELLDAPVLLVGNIDPGGVFAQLLGTVQLMSESERSRVRGLIINRFRGDRKLLDPGLKQFARWCPIPFAGVVPWLRLELEEEDSLSEQLVPGADPHPEGRIRVRAVRFPYLSNYTDFSCFSRMDECSFAYARRPEELAGADLILLPGTKRTLLDLKWMKQSGIAEAVLAAASAGTPVIGICGGYQMLGRQISDPAGSEGGGAEEGLGILPVETVFDSKKTVRQVSGTFGQVSGLFAPMTGAHAEGYEIHHGCGIPEQGTVFLNERDGNAEPVGAVSGSAFGTYLHGLFDTPDCIRGIFRILYGRKGIRMPEILPESASSVRERSLNLLADVLEEQLDWDLINRAIGI